MKTGISEVRRGRRLLPGLMASFGLALTGIAADDLQVLSDEFDDAGTLSQWQRVYQGEGWGFDQLDQWDINSTRTGHMFMMPHSSSWYQEWRGVQAYKAVTGDFVATTDVTPIRRGGGGPPASNFSLAGILARTPRPGVTNPASWTTNGENYVFLSLGTADTPGTYQFEVKTTTNSISHLEISSAAAGRARIQIARIGSSFIALRQFEGGSWEVHRRYTRADMPATLHVGLTCYTDWNSCSQAGYEVHNNNLLTNGLALPEGGTLLTNPDLEAAFDYMRYQRPQVPAHLAGRNFADPEDVSDAELLAFLGDNANTPGGSTTPARILSPQFESGAGCSMTLELQTNRSYRVQSATSLPDTEWTTLTNIVSTDALMPFVDETATNSGMRFYRVVSP
jgi:hypothetical protein